MVDIVDLALAVAKLHQPAHAGHDIFGAQRPLGVRRIEIQTHVHLHAADRRQVIAFTVEEQAVEQRRGSLDGGRLARAHDAIDIHQRLFAVHVLVRSHRVADIGSDIDMIDVQNRHVGDVIVQQHLEQATVQLAFLVVFGGDFITGLGIDQAGLLVDDILGDKASDDPLERNKQLDLIARIHKLLDQTRRHLFARLGDDLARIGIDQVIGRTGAAHALGEEARDPSPLATLLLQLVIDRLVEGVHDAFLVHAQRIQQRRHRQLAAAVDAREDQILGIEFEIQPRAAIGDDAAGEQQLARGMGLAAVMVEENPRAAVHLRDHDPFGPVHDERTVLRHQGHVAHENVLFLDVLDRLRTGILIQIEHDQPQRHLQRRGIGHVALLAFLDIVFRLFQLVFHEFQRGGLVEILDRKNRLEHALDAVAIIVAGTLSRIQEQVIG